MTEIGSVELDLEANEASLEDVDPHAPVQDLRLDATLTGHETAIGEAWLDDTAVERRVRISVRRSWKERLFSWPWRPWRKYRYQVDTTAYLHAFHPTKGGRMSVTFKPTEPVTYTEWDV